MVDLKDENEWEKRFESNLGLREKRWRALGSEGGRRWKAGSALGEIPNKKRASEGF